MKIYAKTDGGDEVFMLKLMGDEVFMLKTDGEDEVW